jgi:hypothetical protein
LQVDARRLEVHQQLVTVQSADGLPDPGDDSAHALAPCRVQGTWMGERSRESDGRHSPDLLSPYTRKVGSSDTAFTSFAAFLHLPVF